MSNKNTPEIENIPAPLKTRAQWLHWDSSNETPRRPHCGGDFGVSWSEPDSWLSFDEAVSQAEGKPSWGLGYVTAVENDKEPMGIVSVIDLDDAADENDDLEDWVPSLEPFLERDCYIEWSPSHSEDGASGLHIPVVGKDVPSWWSDSHIDGEHAGADLLRNKFCTVTGDKYEGAGSELANYDDWLVDWLAELYESINGHPPVREPETSKVQETEDTEKEYEEEWLTEERVEEALEHIEPSCSYEKWRNIGFALTDHFDSHTAERLFEDWSRGSSKYDSNTPKLIDDITSRGGGGVQIATLVHHAKQGGWSPSPSNRTEKPTPSADGQTLSWEEIRDLFSDSQVDDKRARRWAAIALNEEHDYLYVDTDDRLLKYHEPDGIFEPGGERHVRKKLARELGMQFSRHDRNEILATIEDLSAVDVTTLNAEEYDEKLVCLKNGVLDIETRELKDHSPDYRFTQTVPVEYDPEATAQDVNSFLDDVTQSDDEKKTLIEMIGATLHPEYLKSKFLFLFGEGSNGKGMYFELINRFLGSENVEGRGLHELADNRFAKADLHGKLANIGGDIDDRKLQNVGTIKRLTSNTDPITAERKFGQPFKFVNSATLFFAANEPPAIDDMKRSMGRRLVPIHMATEFVENADPEDPFQKDAVDKEELLSNMTTEEELSGLLNMSLDGMDRLRNTGDVSLQLTPMERLEFYQRFSDPIYRFANDCLNKEPNVSIDKADVYEIYKAFSRTEGHGVRHNNVFWREFRRVFHFEETQPRLDDGSKGPRELMDTAVTEKGLKYAPEHLQEKYSAVVDSGNAVEESSATFEEVDAGRHDLQVTVAEVLEPKPWQQGRGHLEDEAGNIMPYVAEGSENPLSEIAEGDQVRIANARVATDRDGVLRVEVSGVCEIENIPEVPEGQLSVDETPGTVDGGSQDTVDGDVHESISGKVREHLRVNAEKNEEVTAAAIAGELSESPGEVKDALNKLATNGLLEKSGVGVYRVL